jgi:hypothetical protein
MNQRLLMFGYRKPSLGQKVSQLNRRDQQIASINASVEGLREDRLIACRAQILESYAESSIVDKLAHVIELTDREPSDFHVLTNSEARRVSQFNDNSFYWDFFCKELGRSIALAEKRHVFEELGKIPGSGEPVDPVRPSFDWLWEGVQQLRSDGFNPTVLAAPIDLYLAVFKGLKIDLQTARNVELPDGSTLELFWSSRANPLDRFVVLDPRAGEWRVKLDPDTNQRLTVAIGRPKSPPLAVTFLAETVVKYEIVDQERLRVIELVGELPDDFGLHSAQEKE